MSTLTIRKPRKANLRNNIKIMNKPYYLVNGKHPDQKITVHPPKSMRPGPTGDGSNPKDQLGRWIRQFTVEDASGVKQFQRKRFLLLYHFPGEVANYVDEKGVKWEIEAIPEIHAVKARGKARKGFRARSTAGRKQKATGKRKNVSPAKVAVEKAEKPKRAKAPKPVTLPEAPKPVAEVAPVTLPEGKEPEVITVTPMPGDTKPE